MEVGEADARRAAALVLDSGTVINGHGIEHGDRDVGALLLRARTSRASRIAS
jgi:hypothetical protein